MLKQFLKEEKGQSTVEYLLIIAVIVTVASLLQTGMRKNLGPMIDNIFKNINGKIAGLMGG